MKKAWWSAGIAAILGVAIIAAGRFLPPPPSAAPATLPASSAPPAPAAVERLMTQAFTDVEGQTRNLSQWRGKPLIVNFWATWCPPCLQEIPAFGRLQAKHPDVQFVGIAADTQSNVQAFVAKQQINYPILLAADGAIPLMTDLGNTRQGLPFTVILDKAGQARLVRLGGLPEEEAERIIADLSRP